MLKYRSVFLAALIVFLTACVSTTSDIKVSSKSSPKADLSKYKTYKWLATTERIIDPANNWKPPGFTISNTIKKLIDSELEKRDITQTETNPDLTVSFFINIDMAATKLKADPEMKIKILRDVPQGSLGIALVDIKTKYVVWMAQATAEIQHNTPDELVRERLEYAVTKIFKQIPAGLKSN